MLCKEPHLCPEQSARAACIVTATVMMTNDKRIMKLAMMAAMASGDSLFASG